LVWPEFNLEDYDIGCLQTFRSLLNSELDLLALIEGPKTIPLDRAEVDENVLAALPLDEAIALVVAEPLDRSSYSIRHGVLPPSGGSSGSLVGRHLTTEGMSRLAII